MTLSTQEKFVALPGAWVEPQGERSMTDEITGRELDLATQQELSRPLVRRHDPSTGKILGQVASEASTPKDGREQHDNSWETGPDAYHAEGSMFNPNPDAETKCILSPEQIAQESISQRLASMLSAAKQFRQDNARYAETFPSECIMAGPWLLERADHPFLGMLTDDEWRYGV